MQDVRHEDGLGPGRPAPHPCEAALGDRYAGPADAEISPL